MRTRDSNDGGYVEDESKNKPNKKCRQDDGLLAGYMRLVLRRRVLGRLDLDPERALQAAPVDGPELGPRLGQAPLPLGVAAERGVALLGVRGEVLVAVGDAGEVDAVHPLRLLEAPEVERGGVDRDRREGLDVERGGVGDVRVLEVHALVLVVGRAVQDLLVVRVQALVPQVVVVPREALVAVRREAAPGCAEEPMRVSKT